MLRFFVLAIVFAVLCFAGTNTELLKRADSNLKSSSKNDQFKAYDTYKQVYLKALVEGDDKVCKRCLQGIVTSGRMLHIDVDKYSRKLSKYKQTPSKKTVVRSKKKRYTKSTAKKKIKLSSQRALESVQWNGGDLVLAFDSPLKAKDVNYFSIQEKKKRRFRYIFDIHAIQTKNHTIKHREIRRIKLGQYKSGTLRLVIESTKKLPLHFKIDNEFLVIKLGVKRVTAPLANRPMHTRSKIIVIDPGHGGKDAGAVGYKRYLEKNVVLQIAKRFAAILKKDGYKVYMTRSSDKFISLRQRTAFANRKKADLFISIHANAVPKKNTKKAHGIETYFLSTARSGRAERIAAKENAVDMRSFKGGQQGYLEGMTNRKTIASHKLAIDIQQGILSKMRAHYGDVKDGGVRGGPFWVLVGAQMPSVLVEVGFISHPKEAQRLVNGKYQKYFAQSLADGVNRYFSKNP